MCGTVAPKSNVHVLLRAVTEHHSQVFVGIRIPFVNGLVSQADTVNAVRLQDIHSFFKVGKKKGGEARLTLIMRVAAL